MNYLTTITTLLAVIALAEVIRLVSLTRGVSKKKYFKERITATERMIWDFEFKIVKFQETREEIRQEYDANEAKLEAMKKQLEKFPEEGDPEEKARIEDQITLTERDSERYKNQIQGIDREIFGAKPTNEDPNGHIGIVEHIDNLRELVVMMNRYVKTLK